MATVQQVPKYPLDKDSAGNAAWKVLHNYAAQYPDKPLKKDKEEFHYLLKSVLRTIPEGDCQCRSHAVDYVQKNSPAMNNRRDLVVWLCDFHNDTNKRAAKPQVDCKELLENTAECESCKFTPSKKEKLVNTQDKDGPLKSIMGDYKKLSVKVFEELCKRENLPIPRLVFAPCPTATHTSCTTFLVDKKTNDVSLDQAPVVYINPTNFGLRVLVHEMKHYALKMKKESKAALNEEQVEKHTQDIIEKYFPADSYDKENKELVQPLIMKDEKTVVPLTALEKPKLKLDSAFTSYKNRRHAFQSRIEEDFPMFSKYYNKGKGGEGDDGDSGAASYGETGGLLSYFDGFYEPFAKYLNISARSLNLANTPNIFAEGSKVILNSQLSSFGSLLATTILGIGAFVATALNKENIGAADRNMLAQMGGLFLWSGIAAVGSRTPAEIQDEAIEVGRHLATMDFDKITPMLLKGKSILAQSLLTESQQRQQSGVQTRQQQRSGGGSGSGGIGGGAQRRGSAGISGIGASNKGVTEATIERARQRAEGLGSSGPEDISLFKNFSAPGSGGGVGFGGGVVPRMDSGGGIGFTYVPSPSPSSLTDEDRRLLEEMGYPTESAGAYPSYNMGMSLSDDELEEMR